MFIYVPTIPTDKFIEKIIADNSNWARDFSSGIITKRMTPERSIVTLPQQSNLGSEYDFPGDGWNFDIGSAEPRVRNTAQSLVQLLVDPQEWTVEAYKIGGHARQRQEHFNVSYVFYSPSRERPKFSDNKLVLNLKKVIRPEILEQYGGVGYVNARDLKRVDLRPPFPTIADPQNPASSYMVEGVTLRGFNLYLRYTLTGEGRRLFDGPAYDPRRLVAVLKVEDPAIALKLLFDGSKSPNDISKYLQENSDRIPSQVLMQADARLAAIQDLQQGFIADLS